MPELKITCEVRDSANLSELDILQGNLKDLSETNYKKLRKQIENMGFSFPFFVWENEGKYKILDGTHRFLVLQKMQAEGWAIPALPIHKIHAKDAVEAKHKLLAVTSHYAKITPDGLDAFIVDLDIDYEYIEENFDLGVDLPEKQADGLTDPDEVPPTPENPVSRLGDLWILGNHKLLCGDCTVKENIDLLMGGEKANLWSSDPPYGINHVETSQEKEQSIGYKKIANDELVDKELQEFIHKSIDLSLPYMEKSFAFYMWHAMKMQGYFSAAAAAAGILFHRQIIWKKERFVFGRGHYHWQHELCLMGWLQGNEPPFYGDRNQSSVWEIGRENDKFHPTQKPVKLFEIPILNHTRPNEIVYEPFSGSGSNLIAAEKNNRRCFGMELEPTYIDVIVNRWEKFTGSKATLNGKTFEEIKAEKRSQIVA